MWCVVFNQKGGVGKFSIVCNLVVVSVVEGYCILLVDLDVQVNFMYYLIGLIGEDLLVGIVDFFKQILFFGFFSKKGRVEIYEMLFDNLYIVIFSFELVDLQLKLELKYKINKLCKLLDELDEDYDWIYLDILLVLNFYMVFVLIVVDCCLIFFDCDSFFCQVLYGFFQEIEELCDDYNEDLQVEGIVVNQFQLCVSLLQ